MSTQTNGATPPNDLPPIIINGQYIKDLSFEVPNAPGIYAELAKAQPDININVDVGVNPLQETMFEVTLTLNARATLGDKVAFIVELVYAGVMTINVPDDHVHPAVLIECPRLLFPFARNILADVVRDGGFPPMMLQPIDFVVLYRQRMEAMAQAQMEKEQAEAEGKIQ